MRIPFFSRPKAEPEFTPLERAEEAIDLLNDALSDLKKDPDTKHLRPWVRPGDYRLKVRPRVMLGYWDNTSERFVTTYGED